MRTPKIIPASYPDTLDDLADGATFYLDPEQEHTPADWLVTKPFEGQAFLATSDLSAAKDARLVVRLGDGRAFHFQRAWRVRVVALEADTAGDDW